MKSWKRLLKEDIDKRVPNLRDDIKNYPIPVTSEDDMYIGNDTLAKNRKPIVVGLSSLCAVVIAFVIIMCSVFIKPVSSFEGFVFTIEINPSITLATDKNGIVTDIMSSNADADVILNGAEAESKMKGKKISEAVVWYTDKAARLGYLNVQAQSAVRLSAFDKGEKILQMTQSALEHYFMDNGIFALAIAETVNNENFAIRSGIKDVQNAETAAKYIKHRETLFAERQADTLSPKELSQLYETYITTGTFIEKWSELLESELTKKKKNAEDIQTICSLYSEIYNHKDNPATLLKDYWNVKKYYGTNLSGEFGALVIEMDVAIADYKTSYGVEIANETQMWDAAARYALSSVDKLSDIIEKFSADLFVNNISFIADLLKGVDIIGNPLVSILTLPATEKEFTQKISDVLTMDYSFRESKFEKIYNIPREKIAADDYKSFRDNIISEFGTLSKYWNSVKKF